MKLLLEMPEMSGRNAGTTEGEKDYFADENQQ